MASEGILVSAEGSGRLTPAVFYKAVLGGLEPGSG